jgi:PAS domain S-box-containing protein
MGSKHKNYFKDVDERLIKEISVLLAIVINDSLLKKELASREMDLMTILNSSNEGVLRIGVSGNIMVVNDRLCEILSYTEKELLNKKSIDFIDKKDIQKYNNSYKELLENKLEKVTVDIQFWSKKGVVIDCKVTMRSIFDMEGTLDYIIMFIEDKTEERAALNKVLNLENALNYSCSVLFTDENSIITDVNEKTLEYTGYNRDELEGKPMSILSSDYYIKTEWEDFSKTIRSGKIWQGELRNKKKDGSYYWFFTNVIPIISKDKGFEKNVIISFNITDDKVEKNALIREIIEAQEHERERFAMEIHDGLGQMLLASKMNLTAISDLDNLDNEMKEVLDTSVDLLVSSIQEARSISHGLMSRVLNRFGIAYAVDEIINNINITSKLTFSFKHNIENIRFSEDLEMGIYRTLQELIKNIIRHSEATRAYVKITTSENDLYLEIKDNGIGISNRLIKSSKGGIGLRNMKSRIAYLGGVFEIDDTVKKGTKINIRISL